MKLAVLAEADLTGRRRTHRAARPRKRAAQGFFDDLQVGSYVVHHHHGVARFAGMVKRTIGGVERDYLLLEYRGDDKLYVPSDQIDAVRLYSGGDDAPPVDDGRRRLRPHQGVGRGPRSTRSPRSWWCCTRRRLHTEGHAFAVDTPWQHELEESFPYQETPDQLQAIVDVKADMEADRPMDRLVMRRRRVRQDRGGASGPRSRRSRTASRWPSWCPPRCWPSSTTPPSASGSPAIPIRVEVM